MKRWPTRQLGELITIEKGKKAPSTLATPTHASLRYIQIEDLRVGATMKYCEPFRCPKATALDTIIAWDGANAGTVSCNLEGHIGSTLAVLRPIDSNVLCAPFLCRFLEGKFDYLQRTATGATIPHVSKSALSGMQLAIPPLAEQQRIVRLLNEADGLRTLRAQADQRTVAFIPALFVKMFGDCARNPFGWPTESVGSLFDHSRGGAKCGPFGSALKKHEYVNVGVPVWGIPNVLPNRFVEAGSLFISRQKCDELSAYAVETGDLLFSRAGTVGRICVARPTLQPSIIGTNLIRLALDRRKVVPEFFSALLTYFGKDVGRLRANIEEGAYSFMNTTVLKALRIYVPPLTLQAEFAQRVTEIRELEASQAASRTRLDALFQSVLHRAFAESL